MKTILAMGAAFILGFTVKKLVEGEPLIVVKMENVTIHNQRSK